MEDIHNYITFLIVIVITLITIYLGWFRLDKFSITHGPEIVTTLGILGCFAGVTLSLWTLGTDIKGLTNGIPSLLGGLKTAFLGSLAGVTGALVIRYRHFQRKDIGIGDKGSVKEATSADIVEAILFLQRGMVGSEEGSLLQQIKLQRQETNDKLNSLNSSFVEFSKHMVENNQKAIIEALREVIKDFNEQLMTQFGENFKELNHAVGSLLDWQTQYKEELEILKSQQIQTSKDMQLAANAFSELVKNASEFRNVANDLKELLDRLDKQKDLLFSQEKAMSELLLSLKDVTPQFSEKLSSMLSELQTGIASIQSQTIESVKNYGIQTQSANAEMKELLTRTMQNTQSALSETLKENSNIIKEGVLALDKGLQTELNNALTGLGNQLSALSEKFVQDYLPLTEKLREVVRLSESLKR